MPLTGKQRRHLRGLGHALKPVVSVGREGVSAEVARACEAALAQHELIKVKIGPGASDDRYVMAAALGAAARAEVAQVLGKTILLYRPRPPEDERARIELP